MYSTKCRATNNTGGRSDERQANMTQTPQTDTTLNRANAGQNPTDQVSDSTALNTPGKNWAHSVRYSPSATLLHLAADYRLFHTAEGASFADVNIDGHTETLAI